MSKGTKNFIILVVCVLAVAASLVMPAVANKCFDRTIGLYADEIRQATEIHAYRTGQTGIVCYWFEDTEPVCLEYR